MKSIEQQNIVEIIVQRGYHPARVALTAGAPGRLTFIRREAGGCSRELVIPALGIRRELPEGLPVTIEVPPLQEGSYGFTCGMHMMKGDIVVRAA